MSSASNEAGSKFGEESAEEIARQEAEKAGRREIRVKQRDILEYLDSLVAAEADTAKLEGSRQMNNAVFKGISHSREQLNDAVIMGITTSKLKTITAKLDDISRRFDFDSFAASLKDKFTDKSSGLFSWSLLGKDAGILFNSVPAFDTMLGPIKKPERVRKQPEQKKKKEDHKEAKPEEVVNTEEDDDEATNERILLQRAVLTHLSQSQVDGEEADYSSMVADIVDKVKSGKYKGVPIAPNSGAAVKPVDLLKVLVDPNDPVQTVENFFDFAFLIKEKEAAIDLTGNSNMPQVITVPQHSLDEKPRRQMVLSLNMKEMKQLSKLLYGTTATKGAAASQASQASQSQSPAPGGKRSTQSQSQSQSQSSQAPYPGGSFSQGGGNASSYHSCPLHREDPLYSCRDAQEQSDILAVKAEEKKRRASQGKSQSSQSQRKGQSQTQSQTSKSSSLSQSSQAEHTTSSSSSSSSSSGTLAKKRSHASSSAGAAGSPSKTQRR